MYGQAKIGTDLSDGNFVDLFKTLLVLKCLLLQI